VNSMASRTFHPGPERLEKRSKCCEDAARAALESRLGRTLTDAQWAVARGRLLEFVGILRGWDRKTPAPKLGKVEVLCQPEP
jgi:hypothetical protein